MTVKQWHEWYTANQQDLLIRDFILIQTSNISILF